MSLYIRKSHNVTVLLYHLVFPAKYRRAVFDAAVDQALRDVCLGIEARYQLKFLEIGADRDHVHVLVQSVPTYSVTQGSRMKPIYPQGSRINPVYSYDRPPSGSEASSFAEPKQGPGAAASPKSAPSLGPQTFMREPCIYPQGSRIKPMYP
jgi:hypothetical protein